MSLHANASQRQGSCQSESRKSSAALHAHVTALRRRERSGGWASPRRGLLLCASELHVWMYLDGNRVTGGKETSSTLMTRTFSLHFPDWMSPMEGELLPQESRI
ncbi:hypothetical protein PDJAM_G00137640 [Pangasius djambal]|uniref:Uncharacterized protein n=1 Tax=Pangasius djambal TaxID=1691987 RepID=A0ACC5ZE34_9TELE|nr:hypothetical protein [Pangasius djambal]